MRENAAIVLVSAYAEKQTLNIFYILQIFPFCAHVVKIIHFMTKWSIHKVCTINAKCYRFPTQIFIDS